MTIEFKCPKCGAEPNEHGRGPCVDTMCMGFICECDGSPDSEADDHGTTYSNACLNAECYHCGWSGKFPKPAGKTLPWEKKALEAGWTPPEGWGKK